jgi:hypothetical protein
LNGCAASGLPRPRPSAPALQTTIAAEFSDDAVLSNPLPVKVKRTALLSGNESIVLFARRSNLI